MSSTSATRCVRDSSGKHGAVGNREDLERIARPEGARPKSPAENASRMSATKKYQSASSLQRLSELIKHA